ncbi:YolD-like family protein [Caldibacillus lycopersici]|uniref:YolD-like family protein n=1 Tax=Perspicuibacillus lycopersici TaxID=1325689 RepID=A0AAE3LNE9_9BACI|nr:YolD-like family protein [Perspicuibacillus lycopersici]MCU9613782.1 YolD-like family protein [Perspicuibacillus lycopersici]
MIRDRGRIKWTAMMLPEHVKMLRDWAKEEAWEQPQVIDEQKWELMNATIVEAQQLEKAIVVHFYTNHHIETVSGMLRSFDPIAGEIQIIELPGTIQSIRCNEITDIEWMEEE